MLTKYAEMLSDAIDPVMGESFDYRPMKAGNIKGPQPDPERPANPELVGILELGGGIESPKAGNGREAKFHSQVTTGRSSLSVDKRQFKGGEPQADDMFKQEGGNIWQIASVFLDGQRYKIILKRVSH